MKKLEGTLGTDGICWMNEIAYNERKVNGLEAIPETKREESQFIFITNIKVNKKNVQVLVGVNRSRWKVENEGFNRQKNI